MSLAIGQSIAHYTVLENLGQGGMGIVYKARDSHLDRLVALKVLPHDKVADPERRRRFAQEAKAASSLHHPHIVTIYDIDSADGVTFIAMQYVAGKTLEQAIRSGRLPMRDKLKYAIQIADALAAAHAAGIVHRDIKPANIIVTEAGEAKVLDFGLAKLTDAPESGEDDATRSLRAANTEPGVVIGTVAYMSPEQAEGNKVDARSDIFSFGSVLYEMCTGRRAFSAETRASTLAAVLREDPKPASSIDAEIPREVEKIIQRCLRKDPARRYQHMADVKLALEEAKEESESGAIALVPARPTRRFVWPVLAGVAVLAIAGGLFWSSRRTAAPLQPVLTRLTSDPGWTGSPAISPDGKLVAYASDRGSDHLNIWVRQIAGGEPIQITHEDTGASEPSFSPDSSRIVFRSERDGGGVYVVSALGGEPRLVINRGHEPRFSPDGAWIAVAPTPSGMRDDYVQIVPASGGEPRRLGSDLNYAVHPLWSPDSKFVLVQGRTRSGPDASDECWLLPIDGSRSMKLDWQTPPIPQPIGFDYPTAWLGGFAYTSGTTGSGRSLWRISLDPKRAHVDSTVERLTFGTATEGAPSAAILPGGDVRVVFASESSNYDIWSLPADGNRGRVLGEIQRVTDDPSADARAVLSADGRKAAYRSDRTGTGEIWVRDMTAGRETMVSSGPGDKHHPILSPDGKTIVYSVVLDARPSYAVASSGGTPEKVCDGCYVMEDFTPDGAKVTFGSPRRDGKGLFEMFLLDLASRTTTPLLSHPDWDLWGQTFSPDGRWIAFHATEKSSSRGVHIAPFRTGAKPDTWITIAEGSAQQARWSPDGNLVYYISKQDGFECLWAQRVQPGSKRPEGGRSRYTTLIRRGGRLGMSRTPSLLRLWRATAFC